jgi:hypothetical protein
MYFRNLSCLGDHSIQAQLGFPQIRYNPYINETHGLMDRLWVDPPKVTTLFGCLSLLLALLEDLLSDGRLLL